MEDRVPTSWAPVVIGAFLFLVSPAAAEAQQTDVNRLSLEELMTVRVEPVFGASKRTQPATEAPSAVTIVTASDIARYGYRSLGDILRSVRGLYVTDDHNYSYVGARGFAVPGDYNARLLVVVDGHRLNDNIYDQAGIGLELGLDVGTFERVEVIRGPSSSLYGTSAFFAVVNITTKLGGAIDGLAIGADAGMLGARRVSVMAGRTFRNGLDVRLSASGERSDGEDELYFAEFDDPSTNDGIAAGLDGEKVGSLSGRVMSGGFSLGGAYGWRRKTVPTAAFETMFNQPGFVTTDERAYVDAAYDRKAGPVRLFTRAHADRYAYDGEYPYAPLMDGESVVNSVDYARGVWWGAEGRATTDVSGRQTLTVGLEFRDNARQDQGARYSDDRIAEFDTDASTRVFSAYVQDEIRVRDRLIVGLGGRYDAYTGFDRFSPKASVVFAATSARSFKYLFGTAFRAPNAYEFDYLTNGVRNDALKEETITSHEVVWEEYVSRWLRTSVSGYFNAADDLITLMSADDGTLSYANAGRVRASGVELEGEVKLRNGFQALGSYSWQDGIDRDTRERLTNAPVHLAKFRMSGRAFSPGATIAGEVLGMSRRLTLSGASVDAHAIVNLTYDQPLGPRFRISATVRNVLDADYADPGGEEHVQNAIPQDGIAARVGFQWAW